LFSRSGAVALFIVTPPFSLPFHHFHCHSTIFHSAVLFSFRPFIFIPPFYFHSALLFSFRSEAEESAVRSGDDTFAKTAQSSAIGISGGA
jgi:hypothetical protein